MLSHGARRRLEQSIPETPYQSGTATDPRTRLAVQQSGVRPQGGQPSPIPTGLPSPEGVAAEMRSAAIRRADDAEQKRREHDERVRLAHIAEAARRKEMLAERDRLLDVARATQAAVTEKSLIQSQIESEMTALGATVEEAKATGERIRSQYGSAGLQMPALWSYTLSEIRQGK